MAAGYVLNEIHKDNKKDVEKAKQRRKRSHDRKERREHRHDSKHHSSRPQQDLRPPQQGPPRPYSAPPPGSHPMWQPQPPPPPGFPQQQWHPQPIAYHPPQQAPAYPPPQQAPGYHQPPQRPTMYPPPNVHIDLKTGKIQHNMLPPDMQARTRDGPAPRRSPQRSGSYERTREAAGSPPIYGHDVYAQSQRQMNPQPVADPRSGYAELDSETPGRYRPHRTDSKEGPPPAYRE